MERALATMQPDEIEAALEWFDGLTPEAAREVYRALVRDQ
jgi:hypothetical protein